MSRRSSYLYVGLIFLTGVLTMLCQIIWIREYTTLFGIHTISVTTLLATFSGCMAVGSYVFGKVADKNINKLFLYALMLTVIGIFIFLHPYLFGMVINFYLYLNENLDLGTYSVMFIRTTVSFFYFLIPASLMGGILPVLSKGVVRNLTQLGRQFGILYGFYTAGLMTGSYLTGFILIRLWGIHKSLLIAAALSLLMALISFLFFHWEGKIENISRKINIRKSHHSDEFVTVAAGKWKRRLLRIFTVGSFAAVTYKIVWIRMLVESSADKTSYFHTLLSVSFLGCLALGNFVASRFADKIRKKFFVLAIIEILIGLTSILSIGLFGKMLYFLSQPSAAWGSWTIMMAVKTGILWVLFLLPFALTGFVFPLVTRMYAEDLKTLGRKIGALGVLDVVGAIAASFIITFIFIPFLGTYKVFIGAALVNTGIGIFILLRYRRIKNSHRAILTLSSLIIVIGIAIFFSEKKIDTSRKFFSGSYIVETRHEGSTANADVHKNSRGDVVLYINGAQAVSSNPAELKGDKMLSCVPFLFKPDAEKVMIIGLGIGITAKSMADVGVPEIDIVEISPEVTNVAADAYAYVNDNILANENISITIEDGRSFLFRTDKRYDIIICNAAHPRLDIDLYTEEYYRLCRKKLSHQGYLCQWMPTNWVTENEFRSLIKSCTDVFPHVSLWHIASGQTLLLASAVIQQLDFCQSQKLFNLLNGQCALTSSGIDNVDSILAGLLADDATLRKYTREASVNTDIFPRVEFSRFIGDGSDKAIVEHLSSFRVSYDDVISFDNCPESAREVLDVLTRKNVELRQNLP